uniref:CCHC NOA-type domain-containing protein n=1 Tax=Glossina pallidipes TaxID=7398 RepID=A0A1A9ZAR8_GLOPL
MSDEDSFVILDTLSLDSKADDNSSIDSLQQSLTTATDGVGTSSIKPKKNSKSCGYNYLSGEFKDVSKTQQRRNAESGDRVQPEMADPTVVKDSKLWQTFQTSTESETDFDNSIKEGITTFTQNKPFVLTPNVSEGSLLEKSKLSKEPGKENKEQETSTFCKTKTDNESPFQSWLTVSHPNADIMNSSITHNKIPKNLEYGSMTKGIANESDIQQRNTAEKICTQSDIEPQMGEVISVRDSKLWRRATISTRSEKDFDNSIKFPMNSCAQNNSRILTPHSVRESLSNESKMSNAPEHQNTKEEMSTSGKATSCVIESKESNESPLQSWLTVDHSTTGKIIKESKLINASAVNNVENERKEESLEISSSNSGPASAVTDRSSNSNLAASFILGEINVDVLKTSVYSQFPSISMQASAEDIVKLQNLLTEHTQLQSTLTKFTNTLQQYHRSTLQFKDERQKNEKRYSEQLQECQKQIQQLQEENTRLNKDIGTQLDQIKALDMVRQKDREEMIQSISEKSALIENMRVQIEKLEQSQLGSFDVLPASLLNTRKSSSDAIYIKRDEHQKVIKDLERQLSELLAKNLDFNDMEKQYIDELNCLKVNLTAAEELIRQSHAEINELKASNLAKQQRIEDLNQRITLLEQNNQVHRHDFELERQSREKAVGEKQQMLKDLRILQKRNQKLIEERQNQIDNYEKFLGNSMSSSSYNNPIQYLVPSLTEQADEAVALPIQKAPSAYRCPVCDKAFKTLMILHSHVNDCIDKN